jgi:hypothetical protein
VTRRKSIVDFFVPGNFIISSVGKNRNGAETVGGDEVNRQTAALIPKKLFWA